jgi:hypothetical protein
MGPLGYSDSTDVFSEDDLLLTASGVVKPVRQLKEGETLIRFPDASHAKVSQRWIITKIQWVRKGHL